MTSKPGNRDSGSGADRGDSGAEPESAKREYMRADGDAWAVISYLLGGPIVWGAAGWALDAWLGTAFFLPAGLLLGMGAALYLVWVRYGKA